MNITTESSINTKLINKTFVSTNDKKIIKVLDNSVDIINRPENISTDKNQPKRQLFIS